MKRATLSILSTLLLIPCTSFMASAEEAAGSSYSPLEITETVVRTARQDLLAGKVPRTYNTLLASTLEAGRNPYLGKVVLCNRQQASSAKLHNPSVRPDSPERLMRTRHCVGVGYRISF